MAWGFKPIITITRACLRHGCHPPTSQCQLGELDKAPSGDDFFCVVKQGTAVRQQNKSRNGDDMESYILMLVVFLVKQPMEFVGASVFDGKPFLLHNIWKLGGFLSSGYTLFSTRVYGSFWHMITPAIFHPFNIIVRSNVLTMKYNRKFSNHPMFEGIPRTAAVTAYKTSTPRKHWAPAMK